MTLLMFAQVVVVGLCVWLAYAAGLRRGRGEGMLMMRLFLAAAIKRGDLKVDVIEKIGAEAFKG